MSGKKPLIQEIEQITVMNQPVLRQFEEACLEFP